MRRDAGLTAPAREPPGAITHGASAPSAGGGGVIGSALLALVAGAAGLLLAGQHALWPVPAVVLFLAWAIGAARWPGAWLWCVPLALPWLNFSPWTGTLWTDEFDLLLLGALAGGHAGRAVRQARARHPDAPPAPRALRGLAPAAVGLLLLGLLAIGLSLLGLWRGIADSGLTSLAGFDGYTQAGNSVRVGKSFVFCIAFWPLWRDAVARLSDARAFERFALGMQGGLLVVALAVLWERAGFPGWLDFSTSYRTTALFWEMHVGGAAIDAYVAMAAPFAARAVATAKSRRAFAGAAALALLTAYAVLTTFSRGAYLGVAVPLGLLGVAAVFRRRGVGLRTAAGGAALALAAGCGTLLVLVAGLVVYGPVGVVASAVVMAALAALGARRRPGSLQWRQTAVLALVLALLTEAVVVVGGGTFMRARMATTDHDFGSRRAHWERGIGLLRTPADWLVGIGLGRLPARYARDARGGEFPGSHAIAPIDADRAVLRLTGPATDERLAGLYALTQRVSLEPGAGGYRVDLQVRADAAVDLDVSVCEQHLLYARRCQAAYVRVEASGREWQRLATGTMHGPALGARPGRPSPPGVFALAVPKAGGVVEIADASLRTAEGSELLANRDFAAGSAHWFAAARSYFLPWHIDSLPLELLIERGVLGLACAAWALGWAIARLVSAARLGAGAAPWLLASLSGAVLVGTVSSVLDMPRVAFLLMLLLLVSIGSSGGPDRERTGFAGAR